MFVFIATKVQRFDVMPMNDKGCKPPKEKLHEWIYEENQENEN